VFPQTHKLAKLIAAIPATNVSRHSRLNIESVLLDRLTSKPTFFDDVIDIFAKTSRGIELKYNG
jgi:hypothetical protein